MKQFIANRNEVIQGPSPRVLEMLKSFKAEHINLYLEDYYHSILIPKISEIFGIPEEQIIISYGEEDFFRMIFDELDPKKDSVLTHSFHYTYYKKYLDFKGVAFNTFETKEENGNFVFDIENCVQQYQKTKPKILLLTSPNNPTGNSISAEELEKLLKNIVAETLVVVDEAYWGFDEQYDQQVFFSLLDKYPSLVFLRSFSKLYALAGLRIGFAFCGTNVKNLLRYQNRYLGLSRILEEVAIAALESNDYYKKLSAEIVGDRESFINELHNFKNFQPFSSKANFVLVRIRNNEIAERLRNALQKEEVVLCKFVDGNLLRVSIGEKKLTGKFLKLLKEIDKIH